MQPKYNLNNKSSNLIQMNQEQKRKSRHRVIGSVTLLFIALVVLLNVTSNVRPIAINPQVVEIKNTTSDSAANIKISSSANLAQQESAINNTESITANVVATPQQQVATNKSPAGQTAVAANNTTQPQPPAAIIAPANSNPAAGANNTAANNNGFKAGVVANNQVNPNTSQQVSATNKIVTNTAQATTNNVMQQAVKPTPQAKPTAKPKINPAAILDDVADVGHDLVTDAEKKIDNNKVYIQFAALSTQDKASKLQQDLASHGVTATIQQIQTAKGTLYRLRAGPFSKDKAQAKLQELSSDGYSGIITSK